MCSDISISWRWKWRKGEQWITTPTTPHTSRLTCIVLCCFTMAQLFHMLLSINIVRILWTGWENTEWTTSKMSIVPCSIFCNEFIAHQSLHFPWTLFNENTSMSIHNAGTCKEKHETLTKLYARDNKTNRTQGFWQRMCRTFFRWKMLSVRMSIFISFDQNCTSNVLSLL